MPDFILASGSPRRRAMLDALGLDYRILPAGIEEIPRDDETPEAFALRAAAEKAADVARRTDLPVLGSDTVVALDGEILGKPRDPDDARKMLRRLSGRTHVVHTAMALAGGGRLHTLIDSTAVEFTPIPEDIIDWYLGIGEAVDKAGSYAVQGAGGFFIASISGAPQTVIGLPMHRLAELFEAAGLDFVAMLRKAGEN